MSSPVRIIAFYLPQFHPIPENDIWWGKGFTEWSNVTRAKPLFDGHYQPRLPTDLGFYDLRLAEVREAQADLAKEYGIHGFCYHYYWFKGGKRLLERPLDEVLASGKPDFPFCLCWANENWTRRWDGEESEVLMAQEHCPESDLAFFHSVLPIFRDPRYIRVNGRPLLLIYRATLLPDLAATVRRWREEAHRIGECPPYLVAVESFDVSGPYVTAAGLDATCEFPPHGTRNIVLSKDNVSGFRGPFTGAILDYNRVIEHFMSKPEPPFRRFRTVTLGWDNTARKKSAATVMTNFSLQSYHRWLSGAIDRCERTAPVDERIVFINAWNEWAEGTYLEPDRLYGRGYLEATRAAILDKPFTFNALKQPQNVSVSKPPEPGRYPRNEVTTAKPLVQARQCKGNLKLIAVAVIGNEADIVEAFVRDNLEFVDHILITDHNSLDGTGEILSALIEEGLPITVNQTATYNQRLITNNLFKAALERFSPDWIFPLDADEILDAESRSALETELAGLHASHGRLSWIQHVPTAMDDMKEPHPARRIRHRYAYPHPDPELNPHVWKIALNVNLIAPYLDRYEIRQGNHEVVFKGTHEPSAQPVSILTSTVLRHYPVRSFDQLSLKSGLGRIQRQMGGKDQTLGHHQARLWELVTDGKQGLEVLHYAVRQYLDTGRYTAEETAETPIISDPKQHCSSPRYGDCRRSVSVTFLRWIKQNGEQLRKP